MEGCDLLDVGEGAVVEVIGIWVGIDLRLLSKRFD